MTATHVQIKGGLKASGIICVIFGIVLAIIEIIFFLANAGYMIS